MIKLCQSLGHDEVNEQSSIFLVTLVDGWYYRDMKKLFFTLGAVLSLFSYSSDPLALNVLGGKLMICTKFANDLNQNLDPATFDPTKNVAHEYLGFAFYSYESEPGIFEGPVKLLAKETEDYKHYLHSVDFLSLTDGYFGETRGGVVKVTTKYIRFKIYNPAYYTDDYFVINRKNLFLQKHVRPKSMSTISMNDSSFKPQFYCVLAKNKEVFKKYMKNIETKDKEMIDKEILDRKKKQIEEMKDNQI